MDFFRFKIKLSSQTRQLKIKKLSPADRRMQECIFPDIP